MNRLRRQKAKAKAIRCRNEVKKILDAIGKVTPDAQEEADAAMDRSADDQFNISMASLFDGIGKFKIVRTSR